MTTQTDFIKLLKAANRASGSFQDKARAVATLMAKDYTLQGDDLTQLGADHKAMIADAKLLAKAKKVETNRNTWLAISHYLYTAMVPTQSIEFDKGKGSKKTTTIVDASECRTARSAATAAKQIREVHGLSDGTANNGRKKAVVTVAEQVAQVQAMCESDDVVLKAILKMIRGFHGGYNVSKKRVTKKISAPMVLPTDIAALNKQAG